MNTTANTPSRDSHEVRKRLKARQAFFGLARWKVDDSRPNTISPSARSPPMTSWVGVNPPPSLNVSAMNNSENRPKPAPDATVKKMTENAGCMNDSLINQYPAFRRRLTFRLGRNQKAGCMDFPDLY